LRRANGTSARPGVRLAKKGKKFDLGGPSQSAAWAAIVSLTAPVTPNAVTGCHRLELPSLDPMAEAILRSTYSTGPPSSETQFNPV
jgi:hypothetical protein